MARTPKTKKDGTPHPTTTGRRKPRVEQANWRTKVQASRVKFDDDQKKIYLKTLTETGLKGKAASVAGVSTLCVKKHLDNDPDFAELYDAAVQDYADMIADEVVRRGQRGWQEPIFHKGQRATEPVLNEDGTQLMTEGDDPKPVYRYTTVTKFSDRLLELEAKKTNPAYRDKQTIDLNATGGGVLVAPAGKTPEEEIAEAEKANAEATAKREQEAKAATKGVKK